MIKEKKDLLTEIKDLRREFKRKKYHSDSDIREHNRNINSLIQELRSFKREVMSSDSSINKYRLNFIIPSHKNKIKS